MANTSDRLSYGTVMSLLDHRRINKSNIPWERLGPIKECLVDRVEDMLIQKAQMRQRVAATDATFDALVELLGIERTWSHSKGQKPRDRLQAEVITKVEHLQMLLTTEASDLQAEQRNILDRLPEHQYQ